MLGKSIDPERDWAIFRSRSQLVSSNIWATDGPILPLREAIRSAPSIQENISCKISLVEKKIPPTASGESNTSQK